MTTDLKGSPPLSRSHSLEKFPDAIATMLHKTFADAGINDAQASQIASAIFAYEEESLAAASNVSKASLASLLQSLQKKGDLPFSLIGKALRFLGIELSSLEDFLTLVSPADAIERLMQLGTYLQEDNGVLSADSSMATLPSPAAARQERDTLMMDDSFLQALSTAHHPAHKEAVRRLQVLNQIIAST